MGAGGKCKYLLYVASADALSNRRRLAANIVGVHRIHNFQIRPDPDLDILDPAGSGS